VIIIFPVIFVASCVRESEHNSISRGKITPVANGSIFNAYLREIRDEGKPEIAEKLMSVYRDEPEIAFCLCFIQRANPKLVDFILQQPWYLDGITEEERSFIVHGLGNGSQGIATFTGIDDQIMEIIVNRWYVIDRVELSGGSKEIMLVYNNPHDLDNGNKELVFNTVKSAAGEIERLNGTGYPLDAVTVFLAWMNIPGNYAMNGMMLLKTYEGFTVFSVLEELAHVLACSRKATNVHYDEWIGEGLANFSEAYAVEKLSQGDISWWQDEWNSSVRKYYDDDLVAVKKSGVWDVPISTLNGTHEQIAQMGFLFIKDLYDIMGEDSYIRMMSSMYEWQSTQPPFVNRSDGQPASYADGHTLEEHALKACPDEDMKTRVSQLFKDRVWGNSTNKGNLLDIFSLALNKKLMNF
jgi:hypothetical protein